MTSESWTDCRCICVLRLPVRANRMMTAGCGARQAHAGAGGGEPVRALTAKTRPRQDVRTGEADECLARTIARYIVTHRMVPKGFWDKLPQYLLFAMLYTGGLYTIWETVMFLCQHCHAEWSTDQLVTVLLLVTTQLSCPICRGPVEQVPQSEPRPPQAGRRMPHLRGRTWIIIRPTRC